MKQFSVLLRYPEGEPDTYYTTVEAKDRDDAVEVARRECIESNFPDGDTEYDVDDLEEILVIAGEHPAL